MKKVINPERETWPALLARPQKKNEDLAKICKDIFAEIRKDGDQALLKYTWFFDKVKLENVRVTAEEMEAADRLVDEELKKAILEARENIQAFHALQASGKVEYNRSEGYRCWQESRAIEKVGLYVPGGTAPLFSTVLMLAIPAQLAGCREIVLCTPPGKNGSIEPAILWAARLCGITGIFKVGGVQAIGAMALGSESIPRVYKIFGPGNQYVMAAKQLACHYGIAIDMPAGPSEVLVVADASANPAFVASDLLAQAEHGPDSQVMLVTTEEKLLCEVDKQLQQQINSLPRKKIIGQALEHSKFIVLRDLQECMEFVNEYAPEHLILCVEKYRDWVAQVRNAGSVFLGNYSPESAGDYASGTNHTLPTNGYAKMYSGVNLDAFVKKITFQEFTREGLETLAPAIEVMAETEQLQAHRKAVEVRLEDERSGSRDERGFL